MPEIPETTPPPLVLPYFIQIDFANIRGADLRPHDF